MYKAVFVGSVVLMAVLCGYFCVFTVVEDHYVHVSGRGTKWLAGYMLEVKSYGWPFVHASHSVPVSGGGEKYWLHYGSMAMNLVLWGAASVAVAHTTAIAVTKGLRRRRRNPQKGVRDGEENGRGPAS